MADTTAPTRPDFRPAPYLPVRPRVDRRADGSFLIGNANPVFGTEPHMLSPLRRWAETAPDRIWLAQRDCDGWARLPFGEAWRLVQALAQGLVDLGAGPDGPVMILSRNSVEHALITYAALLIGAPVTPVTPAYSLLSADHERLKYAAALIGPKVVFAEDGAAFARALTAVDWKGAAFIHVRNAPEGLRSHAFADLCRTAPGPQVAAAFGTLSPDMVSKVMLTSGSTGKPKAVINTHRMIASNSAMIRSVYDPAEEWRQLGGPPVMVNFLPWSHTFGANAVLHYLLHVGGALYIDWGAPTPERFSETVRNLKDVSPTHHTTVPAAWVMMATELEKDRALAERFFERLVIMAYGGAAMGQDIYERIQAVAVRVTGERITLSAGYGATETAPTCSNVHWPNAVMGLIGLPIPGCEMKLAPVGEKLECRVRGPHITPGYLKDAKATAAAFDEEGFYRLGDAVRFVDPDAPEKGLAFDGRIAEEFKLTSGAWVSAGKVRVDAVAAVDGALSDAVICGENEAGIGLLGFVNPTYCRRFLGEELDLAKLARHPAIRALVTLGLVRYNAAHPNSAQKIARAMILPDAPRADAGEITDKGYLNQATARSLREEAVRRLFAATPDADVIVL